MTFHLTSPSFGEEQEIPSRYTSDGADVSPPLAWSDPPRGTASFALVVDDPDAPDPRAPKRTWVHWVLYNVPSAVRSLPEAAHADAIAQTAAEGRNDWQDIGWGGPSPPIGRHRYFFTLYALDTTLDDLTEGSTKRDLERAMKGHVLGTATLMGTYQKKG